MADNAVIKLDLTDWKFFLGQIAGKGSQIPKILRAVFNIFGFKDIVKHFDEETGPDGKWPARSPVTQKIYADIAAGNRKPPKGIARRAFSPTNKILQLTGKMRQSVIPSGIKDESRSSVRIFSNADYSARHNDGTPRRQFLWMSDGAMQDMGEAAANIWVDRHWN